MLNTIALVRRTAFSLLARRDHSLYELSRKLTLKNFDAKDINTVISALCQEGLLNDERFTENYIRARRIKGYGPIRIQAELLERGIAQDLIEHQLKIIDNAWLDAVRKTWQKRFKNRLPQDQKSRAQQMRFLYYRGFTSEQIKQLFHSDD